LAWPAPANTAITEAAAVTTADYTSTVPFAETAVTAAAVVSTVRIFLTAMRGERVPRRKPVFLVSVTPFLVFLTLALLKLHFVIVILLRMSVSDVVCRVDEFSDVEDFLGGPCWCGKAAHVVSVCGIEETLVVIVIIGIASAVCLVILFCDDQPPA
jgi:hypothetical protein